MKVIRLVEAPEVNNDAQPQVNTNVEQSENNDYVDVNVNEIKDAFRKNDKSAMTKLSDLFSKVGRYCGNEGSNIMNSLNGFDQKFVKYFLRSLGYENLTDKNNIILGALANPNAAKTINKHKDTFVKFYNTMNRGKELGIKPDYIHDLNSIIFNEALYHINEESTDKLITHDIATDGKDREKILTALANGGYGKFNTGETATDKRAAQAANVVRDMSDKQKRNWFNKLGVDQNTANKAIEQIKNEVNNKQQK